MTWQITIFSFLAIVLLVGAVWFERSRPSARIVAAVAALAALGVAGRLVLAPIPNVVATTDIVLITGFVLGGPPGFAVGALSALISNFWLGQGPWTPWQMAGWGLVGIGGALLAKLTNRTLGRVGFAIAGAIAGFAYGALLDLSAMVSFGGEQSLDRYLALSARGIPFNVAHAAGNAAIMFAAGPALVRIIERYRDRFEVEWEPLAGPATTPPASGAGPGARAGLAALLAVGLALPLLAGSPARAGAADAETASAGSAASWLRSAQGSDGGYGIGPGYDSNAGMTGWAMLGLEAAGINPLDIGGGKNPVAFLRERAGELDSTGDLERTILALRGAGVPVTGFGGHDLAGELRSRQSGNGSYEKQVNLTAYAVLARLAAGDGHSELDKSADWLRGAQRKDGGWASTAGGASEPDSTGAALQALAILGADKPVAAGVRWLRKAQNRDGGWSLVEGSGSNSQSTAWAIQGLIAAGVSPGSVSNGSRSGLDYLQARSASDGHYAYSSSSDQTPVWVTAQALTAVEGEAFPIAPVPRSGGGSHSRGGGGGGGGGSGSDAGDSTPGSSPGADASPGAPGSGDGSGGHGDGGKNGTDSGDATGGSGDATAAASTGDAAAAAAATPADPAAATGEDGQDSSAAGDDSGISTPIWIGIIVVLLAAVAGGWFSYRGRDF
jgi:energy-coupling factor transport system substrate-specific component